MNDTAILDSTSLDSYRESCLRIARARLSRFRSLEEIAQGEEDLNAYPHLDRLTEPREVVVLDPDSLDRNDLDRAEEAVLEGRVFWEHTAAGEATRLKLGTKYLIFPPKDLMPLEKIARMLSDELKRVVDSNEVSRELTAEPDKLLPLNLGLRHMLQMAFDISNLAQKAGLAPPSVLARQKLLIILNEKTADLIMEGARQANFMGFARENCHFMIQPSFPGIDLKDGVFRYDPDSARRLHNHGQLIMQETMDDQIFHLDRNGRQVFLKADQFEQILAGTLDKISYNIEDLDYLSGSIDWPSLALALKLGAQGYHMIMEIVANNPDNPQKGGLAAYDPELGRNVMIESFQLKGLPNEKIKFLNKNFNHYTNPAASWRTLKEKGLPMPVVIKKGRLYFQPVQGDVNFLVKTAFVMRKTLKPIRAWKSAVNTIAALNAMADQDRQPGFREFAEKTLGRNLNSG